MLFVGGDWVYEPQNAPMLWRRIIAGTGERFEGHTPYQLPQKAYPLAQRVVPDQFDALAYEIVSFAWVSRSPYLAAAVMAGRVVTPTPVD